jgi:hypothetical protein
MAAKTLTLAHTLGWIWRKLPTEPPFFVGGCYAWRTDGPVVAEFFPQFVTKPAEKT